MLGLVALLAAPALAIFWVLWWLAADWLSVPRLPGPALVPFGEAPGPPASATWNGARTRTRTSAVTITDDGWGGHVKRGGDTRKLTA